MSVKYQYECDLCSKQEENTITYGLPPHWSKITLNISYYLDKSRDTEFYICSTCYHTDDSQLDTPKKDTPLKLPSKSMKNIFKRLFLKISNKHLTNKS